VIAVIESRHAGLTLIQGDTQAAVERAVVAEIRTRYGDRLGAGERPPFFSYHPYPESHAHENQIRQWITAVITWLDDPAVNLVADDEIVRADEEAPTRAYRGAP
jgi:hypothetical protein